ncbi:MAG: hypothetical protein BWY66_00219 [bacterium ADurb.Bin374]|nr:MAG: hypothetical protein BWY66_00219 [bacterium ADurb.Bin374]
MRIDAFHGKLELFKASAYENCWTLYDPDGNPVDLSTFTGKFRLWATRDASTPLIDVDTADGGITLDALGNVALFLSDNDTDIAATEDNPYLWNVMVNDGSNDYLIAEGPGLVHDKSRA